MRAALRQHPLLALVVVLLPVASIPLELGLGRIEMGIPLFALTLLLAVRYAAFDGGRLSAVEAVVILLGFWITCCLVVFDPLAGRPAGTSLLIRELGLLIAGVTLFRLARRPELKPTIMAALGVAFVLTLLLELYQVAAGLPRLLSAGYSTDAGYFFFTIDGTYRPFGTFTGPTVFGTFLAMLGTFLSINIESRRLQLATLGATVVGVVLTDTRAAWIGVLFAMGVVVALSPDMRRRATALLPPAALGLIAAILIWPATFAAIYARFNSANDQGDTSRVTRLDLWRGVIDATSDHHSILTGLGQSDWKEVMYPQVGGIVDLGHAHSNFFQEWFRYGLIGSAIFALLVVVLIGSSFRSARRRTPYALGSVAVAVIFLADSVFNNSLSNTNFMLALFLLIGLGQDQPSGDRDPRPGHAHVQGRSGRAASA